MEVRCCCDCHLIGYIEGEFELGRTYRFALVGGDFTGEERTSRTDAPETLDFQCAEVSRGFFLEDEQVRAALKSRDYPLSQLLRIPSFRPASVDMTITYICLAST